MTNLEKIKKMDADEMAEFPQAVMRLKTGRSGIQQR